MNTVDKLSGRIESEFSAHRDKIKKAQTEKLEEHQVRQERLAKFEKLLTELPTIWKPRLELLLNRFGKGVQVTPHTTSTSRAATFQFQSELAKVELRLSAATDPDVRKLILDYNLTITPVLMQFEPHAQAEWPLDAIDRDAMAAWIDDRLIGFVKTYLSMRENQYYLKNHMVEDPIAHVRFPKFAAATTVEWKGKTYYFIGDATRREFELKEGIA